MKGIHHIIIASSVLCLSAVSCSKELGEGEITVSVNCSALERTKAGPADEAVVKMDAFILDASGSVKSVGCVTGGTSVKFKTVKEKNMTVAAVLNCSCDLSGVKTLSDIAERTVALKDNAAALVMYGAKNGVDLTSSSSVTVNVARPLTRVLIRKITNDLPDAYASAMSITGVYLINVADEVRMDGTALSSGWCSWRRNDPSSPAASLTSDIFTMKLEKGESDTQEHRFFACANPTTNDCSLDDSTPRYTRLVVEALIGDTTYYYPLNVTDSDGNMKSGYSYEFNSLTIMSLGSLDPDIPVRKGTISLSVSICDWEGGGTYYADF